MRGSWVMAIPLVLAPAPALAQCFPTPAAASPCCALADTRFTSGTELVWQEADPSCTPLYDVARGDLRQLFTSKSFASSSPVCLPNGNGTADTLAKDLAIPAVGEGLWYIPRVDGAT